jgi:hypothetical protein
MAHPHSPEAFGLFDLHSDHNNAFAGTTTAFSTLFDTTNQSLVNLHITRHDQRQLFLPFNDN